MPSGRCCVQDVNRELIGAVRDVVHVELERERRLAQVAGDAVERAQVLDDRAGRGRAGPARGGRLRSAPWAVSGALELDRRA